jgi:hypothetical protein
MAYHRPSKREREERKSVPGQTTPKISKSDRIAGNGFSISRKPWKQNI